MPEGTVYPALHRLEVRGWAAGRWADVGGRRRRIYALTAQGRGALATQHREWRESVEGMHSLLVDLPS